MPLDDNYLPEAPNAKLPKYLEDVLAGAQAGAPAAPLPAPLQNALEPQLDPFLQQLLGGQDEVEVDPETGLIMGSLKRGAGQTFASIADLFGQHEVAGEALEWSSQFPKQVPDIQSVKDLGDLGTFALESAFENAANLLAIGGGAVIGTYTLPATLLGTSGAMLGGMGANLLLQAGESKGAVKAEGGDPNLINVGVPALVNTAIDSFSLFKVAKSAGILSTVMKHMDEAAELSGLGARALHGLKEGAKAMAMEGTTEAIQSYNNLVAAKLATDKEVREAFALSGQDVDELVNAFAAGGLGAAVSAGPSAAIFGGRGNKKSDETLQAANNANETADSGSRAAPVQETEVNTDPMPGKPEQQTPAPEKPVDAPVAEDVVVGSSATFPTNPGVQVRFPDNQSAWEYFAETVKGTNAEHLATEIERATLPDGTVGISMWEDGRLVPLTYTTLQHMAAPVPENSVYEEGMTKDTRDTANVQQEVDNIEQEIEQHIQFLEAGETGEAPHIAAQLFNNTRLGAEDQMSAGQTSPEGQPLPQAFWEKPVLGKSSGGVSTIFSAIVADTPDTQMYGSGLTNTMNAEQLGAVTDLVETMRQKFLPDTPVFLGKAGSFTGRSNKKPLGSMAKVAIEGRDAYILEIDPARIRDAALKGDKAKGSYEALLAETVAHEMGHAVSWQRFAEQTPETRAAVYREYQQWLTDIRTMSFEDFIKNRFPAREANVYMQQASEDLKAMSTLEAFKRLGWKGDMLRYHLSFEEYVADNMAKFVARDPDIKKKLSPETMPFWKSVYQAFKEVFKAVGKFLPQPKFKAWVESMALDSLRDTLLNIPLQSQKVSDDLAAFVPPEMMKLKEGMNYPIEGNVRFFNQTGDILGDVEKLEAMRKEYRVSTGFTRRIAGRLLTPAQIAERYQIPQAKEYMNRVYDYYQTKMKGISEADAVAKLWMDLPETKADLLGKFLFSVSEQSDNLQRKLSPEELKALQDEMGLDTDLRNIYTRLDGSFAEILERLETAVFKDTARAFVPNPEAFIEQYRAAEDPVTQTLVMTSHGVEDVGSFVRALKGVESQFSSLRNRNYFPRMRFGDFTITVKERFIRKGAGKEKTIEFLTFESKSERDKMLKQYLADHKQDIASGKIDVKGSKLDDTTRSLYGMPQIVIDKIAGGLREAGETGLTKEQERALAEITLDLSPGKRYLQHLQHRKNTKGFSTEALRTYASYMSNASNHLARVEHTAEMTAALRDLNRARDGMTGDDTDLVELHAYYSDHFKYLLNPENDWAKLRSFGFLWYLGANVKSALVNTTQVPMVTYPFLASRYGDKATVAALSRGMKNAAQHMAQKKPYSTEQQRLMDRLLQEGIIDESMASDLAGLSEGTALQRILPENRAHRVMANVNYYGGYMFSIGEKYNRQATALAAFELHMKQTKDFEASYNAAKDAIHKSQFEYAKYNRPEFMRGKKSAFFLFYNYTQQFMYMAFAGGGTKADKKAAIRIWGMLLLMSGVQGLPFAEYALSTLDIFGTNAKKFFGSENPKVDIRRDLRELMDDLNVNPDLAMHGAGRFLGAGPLKILEMFGVPVPNLDITGSLGMGEPLPGLRVDDLKGKPEEMAGQLLLNGLGPIPNIGIQLWDSMASSDPDTWKRLEKALPVSAKNVSKATRYMVRGAETTRGGAEFLLYDGENPYEMGEVLAQAMGFSSTRLSQKREMYGEQMQTSMYWADRRSLLLERYAYAVKTKDAKAKVEARKDIIRFNKSLTNKELTPYKISGKSMARSLRSKLRILRKRELGQPVSKKDRLVYSDIESLYD